MERCGYMLQLFQEDKGGKVMPTKAEYEKLLMHSLQPGDVVRIPLKDTREYNSQRVTFARAKAAVEKTGVDLQYVYYSKVEEPDNSIFMEIRKTAPGNTVFLFKEGEEFVPKNIEENKPLTTVQDEEFKLWLKKQEESQSKME